MRGIVTWGVSGVLWVVERSIGGNKGLAEQFFMELCKYPDSVFAKQWALDVTAVAHTGWISLGLVDSAIT